MQGGLIDTTSTMHIHSVKLIQENEKTETPWIQQKTSELDSFHYYPIQHKYMNLITH